MKATNEQLYNALTESIAELEVFWEVPANCPTIKRLRLIADEFKPEVMDVDEILKQIRARHNKRSQ
jgi:hypothetical protein